jgi:hypothetical protein
MNRSNTNKKPDEGEVNRDDAEPTPVLEGITPLNPSTFPRAEDDEETRKHSAEFHDVPDPGPNVGRKDD